MKPFPSRNDAVGARPSGRRKVDTKAARGFSAGSSVRPKRVAGGSRGRNTRADCERVFLRPEGRAPRGPTASFRLGASQQNRCKAARFSAAIPVPLCVHRVSVVHSDAQEPQSRDEHREAGSGKQIAVFRPWELLINLKLRCLAPGARAVPARSSSALAGALGLSAHRPAGARAATGDRSRSGSWPDSSLPSAGSDRPLP